MQDNYLWLENVQEDKAIAWAKKISDQSVNKIKKNKLFNEIETKALEIFGSKDKIPYVSIDGDYVYNLWSDDNHIQGIYRRTKVEEFLKAEPVWEILLDLDLISKNENEKWVFRGFEFNQDYSRALVFLSPGGSDANVMREFDMVSKNFIQDGFSLPESKGDAHWVDNNTIRLARDFGPDSVTESGYAKTIREWHRGEKLEDAKVIFEVNSKDMYAYSKDVEDGETTYFFLGRVVDFYNIEEFLYVNNQKIKLNLPTMSDDFGIVNGQYLVSLKIDWQEFKCGDLIALDLKTQNVKKIFSPNLRQSIYSTARTKNGFYAIIDEDVKGSLYLFTLDLNQNWKQEKINLPANGAIDFLSANHANNHFFVSYNSFNQPTTYYYGFKNAVISPAKMAPSFFKHEEIKVEQKFVKSDDGTMIPYFLVYKKDVVFDGKNPTILYGYGGFEITLKPNFNNALGASWLSRGGIYVLSNIRGGGEYGPLWHQSALKEKRYKAYQDFFAIAEDLIAKKITSSIHLGAMGGSNGGLLMGVCYTMRPDLFKAINCGVPLLDMHRFHKLLAGASWVAEYGDPDDEIDGKYIRSISPYQNIKQDIKYPIMFLNTSTKDDRVHPGHARKFAAKLEEYSHPVYYYENMVGGHAGASNFKESAFKHTLDMCFFWEHLI
jgi:prolyl oligopeptidase